MSGPASENPKPKSQSQGSNVHFMPVKAFQLLAGGAVIPGCCPTADGLRELSAVSPHLVATPNSPVLKKLRAGAGGDAALAD